MFIDSFGMHQRKAYYLDSLGLSHIIIIHSNWHEDKRGMQNEYVEEKLIAQKNNQPVFLEINWENKVFKGSQCDIITEKVISQSDYDNIANDFDGPYDTKQFHDSINRKNTIQSQLESLWPTCTKCNIPMLIKSGKHGDFWGCKNFPNCKETKSLSSKVSQLKIEYWEQISEINKLSSD